MYAKPSLIDQQLIRHLGNGDESKTQLRRRQSRQSTLRQLIRHYRLFYRSSRRGRHLEIRKHVHLVLLYRQDRFARI